MITAIYNSMIFFVKIVISNLRVCIDSICTLCYDISVGKKQLFVDTSSIASKDRMSSM